MATAIYVEDAAGDGAVLVSCDLFAIPAGLHAMVAERLRSPTAGEPVVRVPEDRLLISATHTHQGPGNYMSARVYNALASTKKGYSPALRAFLAAGVVKAIHAAIVDARTGTRAVIEVATHQVGSELLVNRSPTTFLRDGASQSILALLGAGITPIGRECAALRTIGEPKRYWDLDGCPRLRAVDRNMTTLRISRAQRLHAVAVFINVHPTVLHARTPIYSADIFGRARTALATVVPTMAFFNGTEGDVVTRRSARTARDLATLGAVLATELRLALQKPGTPIDFSGGVRGRLHFAMPGDVESAAGGVWRLAKKAVAGVAILGGAEGDRTLFGRLGLVRPETRRPAGEHGVKVAALGPFQSILLAKQVDVPQRLPLGVLRLGSLTLAATPTEPSTAAGWQIRTALGGAPHGQLEIVSLANEYASYLATEDEYGAQDYMGASTLWGPQQAGFSASVLARLATEPAGVSGTRGPDAPGAWAEFGPTHMSPARPRNVTDDFGRLFDGGLVKREQLPAFQWCEHPPTGVEAGDRQVAVVHAGTATVDDANILVVMHGRPTTTRTRWAAVWLAPLWESVSGAFRFRVTTPRETLMSDSFTVGQSPGAACPP